MIITCYRINSGFANVADSISLVRPSSDAVYTEAKVILPKGYSLGSNTHGEPTIFDETGEGCTLCLSNSRSATILAVSTARAQTLKPAPEKECASPLQEARLIAGLTRQQLSDASGVSIRHIQRVESGEMGVESLTVGKLLALADALDADPMVLIGLK